MARIGIWAESCRGLCFSTAAPCCFRSIVTSWQPLVELTATEQGFQRCQPHDSQCAMQSFVEALSEGTDGMTIGVAHGKVEAR